jgi:hypothetical protein
MVEGEAVMTAAERYSIRIKQIDTGCWRAVDYFPTLVDAMAAVNSGTADGYVWAIFDGRSIVARCRPRMQRHGWCRLEKDGHEPSLATLRRVAKALGVTVGELV